MGLGGLIRMSYGLGALLAPDRMSASRIAPDVRDHPDGRMDFRGFGGLHTNIASATLCSAATDRYVAPMLVLNLGCEIADTAAGLLEWRDRGGPDRLVVGSLVLSTVGVGLWTSALRSL
jgi:hypothetical protein